MMLANHPSEAVGVEANDRESFIVLRQHSPKPADQPERGLTQELRLTERNDEHGKSHEIISAMKNTRFIQSRPKRVSFEDQSFSQQETSEVIHLQPEQQPNARQIIVSDTSHNIQRARCKRRSIALLRILEKQLVIKLRRRQQRQRMLQRKYLSQIWEIAHLYQHQQRQEQQQQQYGRPISGTTISNVLHPAPLSHAQAQAQPLLPQLEPIQPELQQVLEQMQRQHVIMFIEALSASGLGSPDRITPNL